MFDPVKVTLQHGLTGEDYEALEYPSCHLCGRVITDEDHTTEAGFDDSIHWCSHLHSPEGLAELAAWIEYDKAELERVQRGIRQPPPGHDRRRGAGRARRSGHALMPSLDIVDQSRTTTGRSPRWTGWTGTPTRCPRGTRFTIRSPPTAVGSSHQRRVALRVRLPRSAGNRFDRFTTGPLVPQLLSGCRVRHHPTRQRGDERLGGVG